MNNILILEKSRCIKLEYISAEQFDISMIDFRWTPLRTIQFLDFFFVTDLDRKTFTVMKSRSGHIPYRTYPLDDLNMILKLVEDWYL